MTPKLHFLSTIVHKEEVGEHADRARQRADNSERPILAVGEVGLDQREGEDEALNPLMQEDGEDEHEGGHVGFWIPLKQPRVLLS